MNHNNRAHTGAANDNARPPWLMFLFLTAVLFLVYHDISYAKLGLDNYNKPTDEVIANVGAGSLTREIALLSLALVAAFVLVRTRIKGRLQSYGLLGWLLLGYVGWAFFSLISAQDMRLTATRLVVFGILCVASVALARHLSPREIVLWTLFSTSFFLFIGVLAEVLFGTFQPFAMGYRFAGTLHPNGQGVDCGLLLLSAVAAANLEKRWRSLLWTCALFGFVFLILTQSRTAIAAAIPALGVYLAAVSLRRTKIIASFAFIAVCGIAGFIMEGTVLPDLGSVMSRPRDNSNIDSFNGRTGVWKDVGYYIDQHPILGYGYGGFWTPAHINVVSAEEGWPVPDSHSAYLDCLLTLGPVGLTIYVFVLLAGIRRAFRLRKYLRESTFAFYGALLVFVFLIGFLESGAVDPSLSMFLTMIILVQLAFCIPSHKTV